jgi:hypothetical protein
VHTPVLARVVVAHTVPCLSPPLHPRRLVGDDAVYTDGQAEYCVRCRGEYMGVSLRQTTAAECLDEVRSLRYLRACLLLTCLLLGNSLTHFSLTYLLTYSLAYLLSDLLTAASTRRPTTMAARATAPATLRMTTAAVATLRPARRRRTPPPLPSWCWTGLCRPCRMAVRPLRPAARQTAHVRSPCRSASRPVVARGRTAWRSTVSTERTWKLI